MNHKSDFGPIYAETDFSKFPVETWNTISAFAFLFLALYWIRKTNFKYSKFPEIVPTLPFILVGFFGGTLYHSLRNNQLWPLLDYVPIIIVSLWGAGCFWKRLYQSDKSLFIKGIFAFFIIVYLLDLLTKDSVRQIQISAGYLKLALMILLPATLNVIKNKFTGATFLVKSIAYICIALFFRIIDSNPTITSILPMGTHFLWHLFGAASGFYLLSYLFETTNSSQSE